MYRLLLASLILYMSVSPVIVVNAKTNTSTLSESTTATNTNLQTASSTLTATQSTPQTQSNTGTGSHTATQSSAATLSSTLTSSHTTTATQSGDTTLSSTDSTSQTTTATQSGAETQSATASASHTMTDTAFETPTYTTTQSQESTASQSTVRSATPSRSVSLGSPSPTWEHPSFSESSTITPPPTATATHPATPTRPHTQTWYSNYHTPTTAITKTVNKYTLTHEITLTRPPQWCLHVNCGAHGDCDERDGSCICHNNTQLGFFTGPKCNTCVGSYMSPMCVSQSLCTTGELQCGAHGHCNETTQVCTCDGSAATGYWGGATCNVCAARYYGDGTCTTYCDAATTCHGHGQCGERDGRCVCAASSQDGHWDAATNCRTCASGYQTDTCTVYCTDAGTCSGHGVCVLAASTSTASCSCHNDTVHGYWTGPHCDACQNEYKGAQCNVWRCAADIPAPTVRFSDTFSRLLIDVNDLGDTARTDYSTHSCQKYLQSDAFFKLTSGCVWLTSAQLAIDLAPDATVKVGDALTLSVAGIAYVVQSPENCSRTTIEATNVTSIVLGPNVPRALVAALSLPQSVVGCAGTTVDLDSSASVLSSLRVTRRYSLVSATGMDTLPTQDAATYRAQLQKVLDTASTAGSAVVTLPMPEIADSATVRLTFRVTLTDAYTNAVSSEDAAVTVLGPLAPDAPLSSLPLVLTAETPINMTLSVKSTLGLRVRVHDPSCAGSTKRTSSVSFDFAWNVSSPSLSSSAAWAATTKTNPLLLVTPYTLQSGTTLTFCATASTAGAAASSASSFRSASLCFTVRTLVGDMHIAVRNTTQIAPVSATNPAGFMLNVTVIADYNDFDARSSDLASSASVRWECFGPSGTLADPCPMPSLATYLSEVSTSPTLSFMLALPVPTSYLQSTGVLQHVGRHTLLTLRATVVDTSSPDRRTLSPPAYVHLLVVSPQEYEANVAFSVVIVKPGVAPTSTSEPLVLSAVVSPSSARNTVTYRWRSLTARLDLTNTSNAPFGTSYATLTVPAHRLLHSAEYTFEVTATDAATGFAASARTSVTLLQPPYGGSVSCEPTLIEALDTLRLSAPEWVAGDATRSLLTYRFSFVNSSGYETVLSPFATTTDRTLTMPVVSLSPGITSGEILLRVQDTHGAEAIARTPVVFRGLNMSDNATRTRVDAVVASLDSKLSFYLSARDSESALWDLVPALSLVQLGQMMPSSVVLNGLEVLAFPETPEFAPLQAAVTDGLSSAADTSQLLAATSALQSVLERALQNEVGEVKALDHQEASGYLRIVDRLGHALVDANAESPSSGTRRSARRDDTLDSIRRNINIAETVSAGVVKTAAPSESRSASGGDTSVSCRRMATESADVENGGGRTVGLALLGNDASSTADTYSLCSVAWAYNVFAAVSADSNVSSPVSSITLLKSGSSSTKKSAQLNVTLRLPVQPASSFNKNTRMRCVFFNYTLRRFSTDGCVAVEGAHGSTATSTLCRCSHLTDFALVAENYIPTIPRVRLDIGNFADIKTGGIIYVAVYLGIVAILAVLGFCFDQHKQKKRIDKQYAHYYKCNGQGDPTRVDWSTPATETASTVSELDNMDALGEAYGPTSDFPRSAKTCRATAHAKAQTSADSGSAFSRSSVFKLAASYHPWLAPFTTNEASHFTVSQRIWLVGVLTLAAMFFNAIFFASRTERTNVQFTQFVVAFLMIVLATPYLGFTIGFFFSRTGRTHLDVVNWYVPKDKAGNAVQLGSHAGSTSDVLASRQIMDVDDAAVANDPVMFNDFELRDIAGVFRQNNQGILFLSTEVARRLNVSDDSGMFETPEPVYRGRGKMEPFQVSSTSSHPQQVIDPVNVSSYSLTPAQPMSLDMSQSCREPIFDVDDTPGGACRANVYEQYYNNNNDIDDDEDVMSQDDNYHNMEARSIHSSDPLCDDHSEHGNPLPHQELHSPDRHFSVCPLDDTCNGFTGVFRANHEQSAVHESHQFDVKTAIPRSVLRNPVVQVLQLATGREFSAADPFFTRGAKPGTMLNDVWAYESQSCAWRLAVEAVTRNEFPLAECLFDVAILLENPDMFFVLYEAPLPRSLTDALHVVVASSTNPRVTSVARSWAQYYAALLHGLSAERYPSECMAAEPPNVHMLSTVLGLHHGARPVFGAFGCVPYALYDEVVATIPNSNLEELLRDHPVIAAHVIRLLMAIDAEKRTSVASCDEVDFSYQRTQAQSFEAATSVDSARTQRDVADLYVDLAARAQLLLQRPLYTSRRYAPYNIPRGDSLNLPTFLPASVRERLQSEDMCHNVFSATIESARFTAMLLARHALGVSFDEFCKAYRREEEEILKLGPRLAVQCHPARGWADALDGGAINLRTTPTVSNLVPAQSEPRTAKALRNEYLTYLINFRLTGTTTARFFAPCLSEREGLTLLSGFHAPRLHGTGSRLCPHTGWVALEAELRIEDTVLMLPGTYAPAQLVCLHCPPDRPIVFKATARRRGAKTGPDQYNIGDDGDDMVKVHNDSEHAEHVAFTDALVSLDQCSHLRFSGLHLISHGGASVGVRSLNGDDIHFEDTVVQCDVLYSADNGEHPVRLADNNQHYGNRISQLRRLLVLSLPRSFVFVGYLYVLLLVGVLSLGTLFATAAMTQSEADEWVSRSCVSVVLKVLVVSPIFCVLKTLRLMFLLTAQLDMSSGGVPLDIDLSNINSDAGLDLMM
eukprot:PhM_4_TR18678/c1_g1_i2/m.71216